MQNELRSIGLAWCVLPGFLAFDFAFLVPDALPLSNFIRGACKCMDSSFVLKSCKVSEHWKPRNQNLKQGTWKKTSHQRCRTVLSWLEVIDTPKQKLSTRLRTSKSTDTWITAARSPGSKEKQSHSQQMFLEYPVRKEQQPQDSIESATCSFYTREKFLERRP